MNHDLEWRDQFFQENWDFYLMNETSSDNMNREELYLDALSEFGGINLYPSFNLFEDDIIVNKSNIFKRNLSKDGDYDKPKWLDIKEPDNDETKKTSVSPIAEKLFIIQKIKRVKSSNISGIINSYKYEKDKQSKWEKVDYESEINKEIMEAKESESLSTEYLSTSINKKKRFGRNQDKGKINF